MMKKYKFRTILEEYNKIHGASQKLPSSILSAAVYNTNNNIFIVEFNITGPNGIEHQKFSLPDFIYYHLNDSVCTQRIIEIVRSKEKEKLNLKLEIWPSNKIRYAYLCTNYFSGAGILGSSCMRYKSCQKALNFYVKNNIKIVVLIDDKNKIHGRALLWDNVNSTRRKTPFTYLDRVYANSDLLVPQFYDLAKDNNWVYYKSTSAGNACSNYYKKDIDITDTFHFPYTDTFRHLYYKDGIIMSCRDLIVLKYKTDYIYLTHTDNEGYFPELDPDRIQEVFSNNFISKKDAIFVKRYDAWVLKVHIANINGDYYSTLDRNIVKTKIDRWILKKNSASEVFTNELIDITKAVKSVKYEGYVHKSNSLYIKDELYHKLDTDVVRFKGKWYHISQCFINYAREKRNEVLAKQKFHFWIDNEVFVPYPDDFVTRRDDLIPKKYAVIAYNLIYSPVINDIEYQEVYCEDKQGLIRLITGEFVVSSTANRKYLKKFNNKYYIKRELKLPNKKQLQFNFMEK